MTGPVRVLVEVDGKRRRQKWWPVHCPKCGRPVAFLKRQTVNRCGWCQTAVVRGGLE